MKKNHSKTDHFLWLKSHIDSYYTVFQEQFENALESGIVEMFHAMVNGIMNKPDVMDAMCEQFTGETDKMKIINAVTFLLGRFAIKLNAESAEYLLKNTVEQAKSSYVQAKKSWEVSDNSMLVFTALPKTFLLHLN